MKTLKKFSNTAIVTSNWIVDVTLEKCKGCAECVKSCPADAIHIEQKKEGNKLRKRAVFTEELCLGCGVCVTKCKTGALKMKSRQQRVVVPETFFDRRVAMAIDNGRLSGLLFEDPEKLSHQAIGRFISLFENSPLFRTAMARESIRSTFLNFIAKNVKKGAGDITEFLT